MITGYSFRKLLKDVVHILKTTAHSAFPIVDTKWNYNDPDMPTYGRLRGLITRNDIISMIYMRLYFNWEDIAENDSPMNDRQEGSAGAAGDALFAASKGKGKKVGRKGKGKGKAPAPKKRKVKPKNTYKAIASSDSSESESDQEEDKGRKNPPKKARTFVQIND